MPDSCRVVTTPEQAMPLLRARPGRALCGLTAVLLLAAAAPLRGQGDPAAAAATFRSELDRALASHPFFSKVDFTVDASHPPFLFLVQRPAKDDPEYARIVVNSYMPFLAELARIYEREYAKPLSLTRSQALPVHAIAVLASEGNYHDFARAIASESLHMARAHYDPDLRIAVTYQIAYGHVDHGDERQALLHEFGHALQHAHSSTGKMTRPVWFNEGLADYRSSGSNVASSLADPLLIEGHVKAMAFGYGNRAGRRLVAPIEELVVPESYGAILEAVGKRVGGEVEPQLALGMFYAQAEMVVRFLHEGADGKYRPGFLRYLAAVQGGAAGLEAFRTAFGLADAAAMAQLEQDWRRWLTGVLRQRNGRFPDLAATTEVAADLPVELPPPSGFDPALLAWQPSEVPDRFAAVRRLCSVGEYEAAALLLPGDKDELAADQLALLRRERDRVQALAVLRDELLAELVRAKGMLQVRVADADCKGKVVRCEDGDIVLLVGKQERKVPRTAMVPAVLLREAARQKKFQGARRWIEVWLRWLDGQPRSGMKALFELGYPAIRELAQDLPMDLDERYGMAPQALIALQRLPLADDRAEAERGLKQLCELVHRHGGDRLLQERKDAIDQLARALAERAFACDDAKSIGVHGAIEKVGDGSVRVRYTEPGKVADADFRFDAESKDADNISIKLAYDGPTTLRPADGAWELIGSGSLCWAMPLAGRQEVEFEFCLRASGVFLLQLCRDERGMLQVTPDGSVVVIDQEAQIADEVGTGGELIADKWHRLRVVHDGEKHCQTFLDGRKIADVSSVGSRVRGDLRLFVHSSNPIGVRNLSIRGRIEPADPLPVRERFVADVLAKLWP